MKLTKQQRRAAELLALGDKGVVEVAQEIGVHHGTIYKWYRKLPEFRAYILNEAQIQYQATTPEVYNRLTSTARAGSLAAMRLFLEHLEKLQGYEERSAQITFTWKLPASNTHAITQSNAAEEDDNEP